MRSRTARIVLALTLGSTLVTLPSGASSNTTPFELGGRACELIPTSVQTDGPVVPFGTGTCGGVRPGARVLVPKGSCTFNFLFKGSDGHRYMGTAGHCAVDSGEHTWAAGAGPVARDGDGRRVGEFAYAIVKSPKDFALIRLDRTVAADPRMCYFGGPTELNTDLTFGPVVLHLFGQGLAFGSTVPGRTLLANTMDHPDHVFANGPAIVGDSGSGVISADGRAVGVLVTGGVHVQDTIDHGIIGITRLKPQLDRAKQRLNGVSLILQTASF